MVNYSINPEEAGAIVKKITDAGISFAVRTRVFVGVSEEDEKVVDRIMNECGLVDSGHI